MRCFAYTGIVPKEENRGGETYTVPKLMPAWSNYALCFRTKLVEYDTYLITLNLMHCIQVSSISLITLTCTWELDPYKDGGEGSLEGRAPVL